MPALKTSKTRGDAKAFCGSLGGHLVAMETSQENDYVINLVFQTGRSIFSENILNGCPKVKDLQDISI